MPITLYKTFREANIEEEIAIKMTEEIDLQIKEHVATAIQPLLSRMDALQSSMSARFDAMDAKLEAMTSKFDSKIDSLKWVVWAILAMVGVIYPATLAILKL
jgi:hypothetical protein